MKFTKPIETLVINVIARDVAAGVELARSLGYQMPKDFDVGVTFVEDGSRTRIRIRLNDVVYDSIVRIPHLDAGYPLKFIDEMWKAAWERIHADCITVSQVWIDNHPESRMTKKEAEKSLSILDALKTNEGLFDQWMDTCRERAKHLKYTPGPTEDL